VCKHASVSQKIINFTFVFQRSAWPPIEYAESGFILSQQSVEFYDSPGAAELFLI
jgi:hypothetical protein